MTTIDQTILKEILDKHLRQSIEVLWELREALEEQILPHLICEIDNAIAFTEACYFGEDTKSDRHAEYFDDCGTVSYKVASQRIQDQIERAMYIYLRAI